MHNSLLEQPGADCSKKGMARKDTVRFLNQIYTRQLVLKLISRAVHSVIRKVLTRPALPVKVSLEKRVRET